MHASPEKSDAAAIIDRARRDPVWYCETILGLHLWSGQRRVIESIRDHQRTSVPTMNGVGKSKVIGGGVIPWFLTCYENSRVIATSPTSRQLGHIWIEFSRSRRASRLPWTGTPRKSPFYEYALSEEWFYQGYTTNSTEPDKFAGHHEENILFIVEEASGVAEPIYEAIEGSLNTPGSKIAIVGNPLEIGGTFYRTVEGPDAERQLWNVVQIGREDLPWATGEQCPPEVVSRLSSREWCDQHLAMWGADDPRYQARVLGIFPTGGAWTVIPARLVAEAQARKSREGNGPHPLGPLDEIVVSCDVARFGDDKTVIVRREGFWARIVEVYSGQDTVVTAERIEDEARRFPGCRVVVDDVGVGGGVTDILRSHGIRVDAFNGAAAAMEPLDNDGHQTYPNRRSEAWFAFRDVIKLVDLDPDPLLATELATPKYKIDGRGRVVEPKEKTKELLGRSPDRADAVLMAFAPGFSGESFHMESPWG